MLVDRLWPRGLKKGDACIDDWAKRLAPAIYLRKWYDIQKREDFKKKYIYELRKNKVTLEFIEALKGKKGVTLLFGAKDGLHTHAIVLKEYLEKQIGEM